MRAILLGYTMTCAVGCTGHTSGSPGCGANADCEAGEVCIDGICYTVCSADSTCGAGNDCVSGSICEESVCVPGCRAGVPQIEGVDGDGSALAVSLDNVTGTGAAHRVRSGVAITGRNLEGATVSLLTPDNQPHELAVTAASDNRLVAMIPEESRRGAAGLPEGRYTLRVANAAGADQAEVWLLQGEPGADGDKGASPSTADIQAAVASMAELDADVTSLGGRQSSGFQSTREWGRLYEAEAAPIASNVTVGAVVDDVTASGGRARKASYGDGPGTLGRLWGVHDIDQGELLSLGPVTASFRLKVPTNVPSSTIATLVCIATRRGESSGTVVATREIAPSQFVAGGTWQTLPLTCELRPDDEAQFIGIDGYAGQITDLSVDYVRLTPGPAGPTVRSWTVDGTTNECKDAGDYTTIPEMSIDVTLARPATLLVELDLNTVGANGNWMAYRLVVDGVADAHSTHTQPEGGADEDDHIHLHRVATVPAGKTNVHAEWGSGAGSICNTPAASPIWMRRLSVIAFQE